MKPEGIFKPRVLRDIPLSTTTVAVEGETRPYDDASGEDCLLRNVSEAPESRGTSACGSLPDGLLRTVRNRYAPALGRTPANHRHSKGLAAWVFGYPTAELFSVCMRYLCETGSPRLIAFQIRSISDLSRGSRLWHRMQLR